MVSGPIYRVTREIATADFIQLYRDAGWWKDAYAEDLSFIANIVSGSACFVTASIEGRTIGMGRALSDGSSDAYIQDVVVLNAFRGKGIGSRIVRTLVAALQERGVDWIGLVGEPGSEGFYRRLGFVLMRGYVPMLYSPNESDRP